MNEGNGDITNDLTENGNDVIITKAKWTEGTPFIPTSVRDNYFTKNKDLIIRSYPNPFKNYTSLKYTLSVNSLVELKIFDLHGKLINTLVNGNQLAGNKNIVWDGKDDKGSLVRPGVFFSVLRIGDELSYNKLILLK